jgi:pyrophosphatase PpaX
MRYPVVLFDLDGTLIDSVPFICDSYAHTLEAHGIPAMPRAHWLAGVGRLLRDQLQPFARDEAHLDALVASYRAYNDEHHDRVVKAFPGVPESVAALHARGARIGVVTSKMKSRAERGLHVAGLERYVDVVVGCDDCARHKPDPEPVRKALEALAAAPGDAVYIGDAVVDLAAGRAAGTAIGAVSWGAANTTDLRAAQPDHWFDRPEELLTLAG